MCFLIPSPAPQFSAKRDHSVLPSTTADGEWGLAVCPGHSALLSSDSTVRGPLHGPGCEECADALRSTGLVGT